MFELKYFYCIGLGADESQKTFTCSKSTIKALEKGVKYVQS